MKSTSSLALLFCLFVDPAIKLRGTRIYLSCPRRNRYEPKVVVDRDAPDTTRTYHLRTSLAK